MTSCHSQCYIPKVLDCFICSEEENSSKVSIWPWSIEAIANAERNSSEMIVWQIEAMSTYDYIYCVHKHTYPSHSQFGCVYFKLHPICREYVIRIRELHLTSPFLCVCHFPFLLVVKLKHPCWKLGLFCKESFNRILLFTNHRDAEMCALMASNERNFHGNQ